MKKILLVLMVMVSTIVFGTDYTSTGSGNWNVNTTWSPNGVPGSGDNIAILDGHTVTMSDSRAINNVTINQGGVLAISATLTLNGTANISGTFQINAGGWCGTGTFSYASIGILKFNISSEYVLNNSATFWKSTGDYPSNVIISGHGVKLDDASRTINTSLKLENGAYIPDVGNTIVYGSNSTLELNINTLYEVTSTTNWWPSSNSPTNVIIGGNGVKLTDNRTINGSLKLNNGGYLHDDSNVSYGNDVVLIYNTGSEYTVSTTTKWWTNNVKNINIVDGSINLSDNRTVNGTLTLAGGNINTNSNTLAIGGSGTVLRTSGHVIGNLRKSLSGSQDNKTFEVGTANGYSPVTIDFGNITTPGDLIVKATETTQPNVVTASETIKRFWSITNSGIAFDNYAATFSYLSEDFTGQNINEGTDEATLVVGKYSGSTWSFPAIGSRNTEANTIQITGVTSFSDFAIGKDGAVPVELSSFTASIQNKEVVLNWATATEINNYGFEVERSFDKTNWNTLAFKNGYGNSNSVKDYTYTDKDITKNGMYYYRLKQIDNNGDFEYSNIVEVSVNIPIKFEVSQNYPNPFNPVTNISFNLPEASNVTLYIFNAIGQQIKTINAGYKEAGKHTIEFDGSSLNSGVYFYKVEAGNNSMIRKMALIK